MPRQRDPNRDKAYELYKAAGGKIDLVEIASQLNVSAGTVRGWKSKDRWEENLNGTLRTKNTERSKRSKGGQPGNKNAVGHGGTGPPGNKNAVKTGEFETLFFDTLEQDERQLINVMPTDKMELALQEIQLLTVRERRMLKRIENLKCSADASEKKAAGMTAVKYKGGRGASGPVDVTEYAGILGQIQAVEDALTRVQARKQKAIDSLHRFGFDDARLEIETLKIELETIKIDNNDSEMEDDGFLRAMNLEAGKIWDDEGEL